MSPEISRNSSECNADLMVDNLADLDIEAGSRTPTARHPHRLAANSRTDDERSLGAISRQGDRVDATPRTIGVQSTASQLTSDAAGHCQSSIGPHTACRRKLSLPVGDSQTEAG